MTATPDEFVTTAIGPRYYAWAVLYEAPARPTEPISFAETEGKYGYFVAYHDRDGRVIRLTKELVQWPGTTPRTATVSVQAKSGSAVYFAVATDPTTGAPVPGERIDYAATEGNTLFFTGNVQASGAAADVTLLRRREDYTHLYAYWPNGQLRARTMIRPGVGRRDEQYDPDGRRLPDPPAAVTLATSG